MSASSKKLSDRQKNILKYIEDYVDERGYPPSIREIGDKVGITSTSVVDYNLRVLEREGRIRRDRLVRPPSGTARLTLAVLTPSPARS